MCRNLNYSLMSKSCMPTICVRCFAYSVGHRVDEAVDLSQRPSTTGRYWERDVVTELVCQVCPIDALWGTIQGCMVASQAEPHCSGSESGGKLEQHAAWHYLVGLSDCVAAQKEPRTDEYSVSIPNCV